MLMQEDKLSDFSCLLAKGGVTGIQRGFSEFVTSKF